VYCLKCPLSTSHCEEKLPNATNLKKYISDCVKRQSARKNWKIGRLSDFERGQIVGARLAGASVTKTATLLGVLRATVCMVMSAYTNHGKTAAAKRNSGR
jgi:hypothetical protein